MRVLNVFRALMLCLLLLALWDVTYKVEARLAPPVINKTLQTLG